MALPKTHFEAVEGDDKFLTPVFQFDITDITEGNDAIWQTLMHDGIHVKFGDPEEIKDATEIFATLHIHGEALDQLRRGETPDGWLFRGQAVQEYMHAFDEDPEKRPKGHVYNYAERLFEYIIGRRYKVTLLCDSWWRRIVNKYDVDYEPINITVNQLEYMREALRESISTGIQSNRIVAITLYPGRDTKLRDMPCLQELQVRKMRDRRVSLRILYRSHDYGDALWENLCYLLYGIEKYVVDPAGGRVIEIILTSQSAHVYDGSLTMVWNRLRKILKP